MKGTIILAAILIGAVTVGLAAEPKGFLPIVLLYDSDGQLRDATPDKLQSTLAECVDRGKVIEQKIVSGGAAAVTACLPIPQSPAK